MSLPHTFIAAVDHIFEFCEVPFARSPIISPCVIWERLMTLSNLLLSEKQACFNDPDKLHTIRMDRDRK